MKFATLAAVVTATVSLAAAQPHAHGHSHLKHHLQKRQSDDTGNEAVVTVYELNGTVIPAAEVAAGLKNGTFVYEDGSTNPPLTTTIYSTSYVTASSSSASLASLPILAKIQTSITSTTSTSETPTPTPSSSEPPPPPPTTTSTPPPPPPTTTSAPPPPPSSSAAPAVVLSGGSGVGSPFPDGQLSCSTFPSEYGAVELPWLGLGGWSGIQSTNIVAGAFDDIMTMVPALCPDSGCCTEGSYCSYACPAGWQKSQWPTMQGLTGQSIGGILCQGGKLHLSNPDFSSSLCMKGASEVTVQIQNTMSQNAAVCRTDYPGTEGETIPTDSQPGTTTPLTCPDAANYYTWGGKPTSAQYYANPAGVSVEDGCQWGSAGKPWGNFAPLNLGVGYSNGAAWLSIFQNLPTTSALLDYDVEIVGNNGGFSNLVGNCKYFASKGQYCSGTNYESCSSNGAGCTVNVQSGTATFVFSQS